MLRHFLQMVLQEDKESSIKEQMKNKLNPQKKEKGLFRYHFQLFLQKPSQLFFCFVLILPKGQPIKKKREPNEKFCLWKRDGFLFAVA